jgi:hypothetical protein
MKVYTLDEKEEEEEEEKRILLLLLLLSLVTGFLPGTSLEPAVIPTAQFSSFTLQYFLYYV